MRATGLNHVSISAVDLEASVRFYEEVLGLERIPTPRFARPVQWLRIGDLQLHLFLDPSSVGPPRHHIGLTIDDFDAAYEAVKEHMSGEWGWELVELPSRQVQLYFRDPGGNLIELNFRDAELIDRARYPELQRLEDHIRQTDESKGAILYLDDAPAPA